MIDPIPGLPGDVVGLHIRGKLTAEDYENVVIPAVEAAIEVADEVRVLVQLDDDFQGIELGALLDDVRLGMKWVGDWDRVAVVSDPGVLASFSKLLGIVLPEKVKVFTPDLLDLARQWVTERD